ncbi:bifunctional 5,10-methylenetetrahydrofolate dehydrogenase/5,10-methenyltetrahydrofolate cyclohydrolase [Streptomyces sp. RY43-2]|uniref:Bifunctional 5,10-methylenetetrahydrofolate dehydrogenase/5,10-methenyltetrahydrofolate cyclohydrolase n=1 Tax=Streptomyces macrolidinus TaxID=2952607 RepID=A0ABT0ZC30_9ACTN|nr:bifunctional 5,10-methylenetetrahydrofolate dehydrogenase/5,10-methenyltetrahydrofolate cyclohydrolase [Streptomyces macrolidinus]MCN9241326.1 bifunctional 5,10-methylenetetrahydrofolate dehydrogenase/5,10-methenyltetrahydrofolate cyclohydrolase [Streptomyces macrolidinus]
MTEHVSGRDVLRQARNLYQHYRDTVEPTDRRVAIIRFEPAATDPPDWQIRLQASKVSAEQKVKSFEHLGFKADHIVLPPETTRAQFAEVLERANQDPQTRAIIVQFPPPAHLRPLVERMDPQKDIDALLKGRSSYQACATAEGICRVVEPFAQDDPTIAVVGSKGFVGQGVVTTLREQGHRLMELDAGDDLLKVRDADIVVSVTGNPGILGPEHLQPHHRLVVDSGFVPQADGSVRGDVQHAAYHIPQHLTPVPGGIGPVEMATLMERVIRKEVDPNAQSWKVEPRPYLTKEQMAQGATTPSASAATTQTPTQQTPKEQQAQGTTASGASATTAEPSAQQTSVAQQSTPASNNPVANAARLRGLGSGGPAQSAQTPPPGPVAPPRTHAPKPPAPPGPGPGR